MKNKRILFIAYYYLPINNAGVQRIEKMVKYLPCFGWRSWVLTRGKATGEEEAYIYRAPELISRDLRGGGYTDYSQEKRWRGQIKSFIRDHFLIPDSKIFWLPWALLKALKIIRREKVEVIFSTFPPATSLVIGLLLKWITAKIWVADFRDGWLFDALDSILRKRSFKYLICKFLERTVVASADIILVTSPDVKEYFLKEYRASTKRVILLTNGYDEEDFQEAEKNLEQFKKRIYQELTKDGTSKQEYFIISHTGAFHFSHPGNTPCYFLKGLKKLLKEHPALRHQIRVVLVGNLTEEEKGLPLKLGLQDVVLVKGLISHLDSIRLRLISHCLLLVDRPLLQTQERSSYLHGKLFEHLRAQKPILALVPQGAVRDFLKQYKVGFVVEPDDIEGIAQALLKLYNKWQKVKIHCYKIKNQDLVKFERKKLAEQLNNLLIKKVITL